MTPRSKTPEYRRMYEKLVKAHDYRALRDGTITRRKLAALQAVGYSLTNLGQRIGRTQQSMSDTFLGDEPVHWKTERAIARLYDELHNAPPPGPYANRVRLRAQRLGYAPPAAWDDIEDAKERPKGVVKTCRGGHGGKACSRGEGLTKTPEEYAAERLEARATAYTENIKRLRRLANAELCSHGVNPTNCNDHRAAYLDARRGNERTTEDA